MTATAVLSEAPPAAAVTAAAAVPAGASAVPAPAAKPTAKLDTTDAWAVFQARAKPATNAGEYDLHLAAHELDLADAISLGSFEEFLCKPKLNVNPFRHQIDAAISYFKHLAPRGLIADDVGLGKTVIAGLIASELMARGRVRSLLIVAPRPLVDQWKGELANKFNIAAEAAVGAEFDRVRQHPCVVTTYQTAAARVDALIERKFDLVIMDEAHKLRSLNGPQGGSSMASAFYKFTANRGATFILMLTATPLQNKLWDIHSLMEILAAPQPNPLGEADDFAARFIADGKGAARRLHEDFADDFRRRVGSFISRRRRADAGLLFPKRLVLDRKELPTLDEQLYLNDCMSLLAELKLPAMEQCTFARSVLSSPAAAASSLTKMKANMPGEVWHKADGLIERGQEAAKKMTTKGRALIELIENLRSADPNWRVIVFTQRRATLRSIARQLGEGGLGEFVCTFQGGDATTNRRSVADFTADPPVKRIFLATDAGAEGLNLQCCSVLINYDLPWNPMCVEQRIGRVQRLGQRAAAVVINNLVLADTLEERVVLRLWEKLELFKAAVGEMEEVLTLAGENDADPSGGFEQEILRMIRKSLDRQDTEREMALKQQSLSAAREKLTEMRAATEEALGRMDPDAGEDEPPPPKLDRRTPRRNLPDFACEAFTRRGCRVNRLSGDRIEVSAAKRTATDAPLLFSFSPDDPELDKSVPPTPGKPRLLGPGIREFGELLDEWKDRATVYALNAAGRGRPFDTLARAWAAERGEKLSLVRQVGRGTRICAELTIRAKTWVHHDRYETLLEVPIRYGEDGVGFELEPGLPAAQLPPAALGTAWWSHARGLVNREIDRPDGPVRLFRDFYTGRRTEQQTRLLRRAADQLKLDVTEHTTTARLLEKLAPRLGSDPADLSDRGASDVEDMCGRLAEQKPMFRAAAADIELRFAPKLEVRPVGLRAIVYERLSLEADTADGRVLKLNCVPISGRVWPAER